MLPYLIGCIFIGHTIIASYLQAEPGVDDDEYSDYDEMPETAVPRADSTGTGVSAGGKKRKLAGTVGGQPARRGRR